MAKRKPREHETTLWDVAEPAPNYFANETPNSQEFSQRAKAFVEAMRDIGRVVILNCTEEGELYLMSVEAERKGD